MKNQGFTLIELLVVVLIIGILAAIALPNYMRSVERSRAASPIINLGSIAKSQNTYRTATEHYTDNVRNLDISLQDEETGETATGSTFESEFFSYKVYGDDKAAATATRKNVSAEKQYQLSVTYGTNTIYCNPTENKTCIDLGFDAGQIYDDNIGWESCPLQSNGDLQICDGAGYLFPVGSADIQNCRTRRNSDGTTDYSYQQEDWFNLEDGVVRTWEVKCNSNGDEYYSCEACDDNGCQNCSTYDENGNMTMLCAGSTCTIYTYDSNGNLTGSSTCPANEKGDGCA